MPIFHPTDKWTNTRRYIKSSLIDLMTISTRVVEDGDHVDILLQDLEDKEALPGSIN